MKGYITIHVLDPIQLPKKPLKVEIKKPVDPQEFFKARDDLYVYGDFKTRILSKAKTTKAKTHVLESFDLVRNATDAEIELALENKKHFFTESEVCAIIAELILKQSKGQKGTLQHNGYANLFYTKSFVVHVHWSGSHWDVHTWKRDEDDWSPDLRVFSPAN